MSTELKTTESGMSAFNDYTFKNMQAMSAVFAKSNVFGLKNPNDMLSIMMLARSQRMDPVRALTRYHVINGTPTLKAEAMHEAFLEIGGKCEILKLDKNIAKIKLTKKDGESYLSEWTIEMARTAGLTSKDVWKKYPENMLKSRAMSNGLRILCPMLCNGFYTPEEQEDIPFKGNTVDVTPCDPSPVIESNNTPQITPEKKFKESVTAIAEKVKSASERDQQDVIDLLADDWFRLCKNFLLSEENDGIIIEIDNDWAKRMHSIMGIGEPERIYTGNRIDDESGLSTRRVIVEYINGDEVEI